ncbi:MAG: MobC family plasmid mobilization relaxosome protein [Proteobacteria bacterium]|nr:MobC family plasmid mobilization relaxosome protein [Pseudomonadota bacterium]
MPRGTPRTVQIRFNLTEKEAKKLADNYAESGAPSRTAFLRAVALGPGWATKLPAWRQLAYQRSELRKIGVNINQLAEQINRSAKKDTLTDATWASVAGELGPLGRSLRLLFDDIKSELGKLSK